MITGPLAPVDVEEFKKAWLIRCETSDSSVDAELSRRACKPETDYLAAAYRRLFVRPGQPLLRHAGAVHGRRRALQRFP